LGKWPIPYWENGYFLIGKMSTSLLGKWPLPYWENGHFLSELFLREASIITVDGMGLTCEQVTTLAEIEYNSTCHKISHLSWEKIITSDSSHKANTTSHFNPATFYL
jgi:hypothetical protein